MGSPNVYHKPVDCGSTLQPGLATDQVCRRRVHSRLRERSGYDWTSREQERERVDRVGDIHVAVIVDVRSVLTNRHRTTKEEVTQGKDGIGDVHLAIGVRVPPHKQVLGQLSASSARCAWPEMISWMLC